MAALPDNTRAAIWRGLMRYWSTSGEVTDFTKAQLRTMVNDLDDFFDANAAAINSAISQPIRGTATVQQKAFTAAVVMLARFDPDSARKLVDTA